MYRYLRFKSRLRIIFRALCAKFGLFMAGIRNKVIIFAVFSNKRGLTFRFFPGNRTTLRFYDADSYTFALCSFFLVNTIRFALSITELSSSAR